MILLYFIADCRWIPAVLYWSVVWAAEYEAKQVSLWTVPTHILGIVREIEYLRDIRIVAKNDIKFQKSMMKENRRKIADRRIMKEYHDSSN